ncbi:MAG: YeeE/YedE thiosulfate transporter family protein [Pseudomonadota bacterium]
MRPYANPYLAGVGLGLVLLACFALTGRGLGASGAFANAASSAAAVFDARDAAHNAYFESYLQAGSPVTAWIVWEIVGVVVGGALSAALAGRLKFSIVKGERISAPQRLAAAAGGGALMGVGAVLARGCTSGQALSGGAMLSVGSWLFMLAMFATAFAVAPLLRRLWR